MKILRFFCLIVCTLILYNPLWSQDSTKRIIKQEYSGLSTFSFFNKLEANYNLRFFYNTEEIPNITISITEPEELINILTENFSEYNITVSRQSNNYFLLKDIKLQTSINEQLFEKRKITEKSQKTVSEKGDESSFIKTYNEYIDKTIVIGSKEDTKNNRKYTLKGRIISKEEKNPIPQVILEIEELKEYTITDASGEYSFKLKQGDYTLRISKMGNYKKNYKIQVLSDGKLDIELKRKTFMIDEAVVFAEKNHNVQSTRMGFEKLDPVAAKKMPVIMGEKDIVNVALLLPGVQSVSELSAGFNIRGSPADQNLFHVDDIPIYNVSHLYGLYSSFSSDAIEDFSLYKSNIPIKYGGRLSSLFEVSVKEGNTKEFSARGGITPISGNIMVEGPIKKDKSSYLISARKTYSDWILNKIKNKEIKNSSASFSDALIKLFYHPDSLNKFSLVTYGSRDHSDLAMGFRNRYSNMGASFKWSHYFSDDYWVKFDLIHSQYSFREENKKVPYKASKHSFEINHSEFRVDFNNKIGPLHTLGYGLNSTFYFLKNGDVLPLYESSDITPVDMNSEQALKNSIFAEDKWELTPKLTIKGGVRATLYSYIGPNKIYEYKQEAPREQINIIDSTSYEKNSFIKNYPRMDYRLTAKYSFSDDISLKTSYNKLHQYLFMLTNTLSISPTDKWKLTDPHVKPMEGHQFSAGFYKNFGNKAELSIESYYKNVNNLVEYKEGTKFLRNNKPETAIIQGKLDAYGIELMLKKKTGDLTGWINYTYSNTSVKAINKSRGVFQNRGLSYPANYDKPHAANLNISYDLTRRINISANAVYSTGKPMTYPSSIYYQDGIEIVNYSKRNEYRFRDYFRIDLSLNIEGNLKKDKFAHGSWSFSVYNLTGRNNPYSLYFNNDEGSIEGYTISILGAVIPSIKYNLKLGNYED